MFPKDLVGLFCSNTNIVDLTPCVGD